MTFFDLQEKNILRELIRNPRISDNQISKRTKVPLKTVNRKRKKLEEKGIINYFTHVNHFPKGTGNFTARQLYIMKFKAGITRKQFLDVMGGSLFLTSIGIKHILDSHLGEIDGHLALIVILESRLESDLIEIFNADLLKELKHLFGNDCVVSTKVITMSMPFRILHNYLPEINLEKGRISENWPDENIFVE